MSAQPSGDSNQRLMGLLAYLLTPIVGIIILVSENMKSDPILKKHAVQSIAVFVVLLVLSVILTAITFGIAGCIVPFVWIVIVALLGIQAYQGKDVNIPVVTDFCKNQGWF